MITSPPGHVRVRAEGGEALKHLNIERTHSGVRLEGRQAAKDETAMMSVSYGLRRQCQGYRGAVLSSQAAATDSADGRRWMTALLSNQDVVAPCHAIRRLGKSRDHLLRH